MTMEPGSPPRRRILVVDDDDAICALVSKSLRDEHDVMVASDGREALTLLEDGKRFDLILSDVMMPRMNGVELYRALLELAGDQAGKFVFFTASMLPPDIEAYLAAVPNAVLRKPISVSVLRQFVRALL
jgi:CheY-like chemotaxis protein